jgi:hypothetical protein
MLVVLADADAERAGVHQRKMFKACMVRGREVAGIWREIEKPE